MKSFIIGAVFVALPLALGYMILVAGGGLFRNASEETLPAVAVMVFGASGSLVGLTLMFIGVVVALDGMWAVWGVEYVHIDRDTMRHNTLLFGWNVVLRRPVTRIALADIGQVQIVQEIQTAALEISSRSEDVAFGRYMTPDDKRWVRDVIRQAASPPEQVRR